MPKLLLVPELKNPMLLVPGAEQLILPALEFRPDAGEVVPTTRSRCCWCRCYNLMLRTPWLAKP